MNRFVSTLTLMAIVFASSTVSPAAASPAAAQGPDQVEDVLFVGNNWDGTVDLVTPDGELTPVGSLNVVPDLEARLAEIYLNPVRLAYFLAIRHLVGEGHDQLVDDMYTTPDGRLLIVSRPSLADVVAIDIRSGELVWRFPVAGQRSDHMALSPDGSQVAVSASTANLVHLLDVRTGQEIGSFETGDSPHENFYTADGRYIVNSSIGLVYTPFDGPLFDSTKGERVFEFYDRETQQVVRRINMGEKLAEAGYEDMSSAVRPFAFSPDERFVYFQVSFFHGFVEYDIRADRVTRIAELPIADPDQPPEEYLLDSAHHGLAMNNSGTKLCVAGTMSDYATIVDRNSLQHSDLTETGTKPYWATKSADGQYCFISWSGTDSISAISYDTGKEVATTNVGDHPQRMRLGVVPTGWPNP